MGDFPLKAETVAELMRAAKTAMERAYCPYSGFPESDAVLTDKGEIFSGCNVENASFGLTIYAERNAAFQAVSAGHQVIVAVAVATNADNPTPPCGRAGRCSTSLDQKWRSTVPPEMEKFAGSVCTKTCCQTLSDPGISPSLEQEGGNR